MKLYCCSIEGENFPLEMGGAPGLFGFYTTRFIAADSPQQAEMKALEMLRADPTFDVPPGRRREDTEVFFESIDEIDSLPDGCEAPGSGYTFFPMET